MGLQKSQTQLSNNKTKRQQETRDTNSLVLLRGFKLVQTKLSRGTDLDLSELQSPRGIQRPKPGSSMMVIQWESYPQKLEALKGSFLKAILPSHPSVKGSTERDVLVLSRIERIGRNPSLKECNHGLVPFMDSGPNSHHQSDPRIYKQCISRSGTTISIGRNQK